MRSAFVKRAMDLLGAGAGLVFGAPLFLATAASVRLALGSPILFGQERPGFHGKPFRLYKFRTMRDASDANGRLLPDSERLTRFGIWLRATSLDELPELFNVFRGEMSLVGPRPLLSQYLPRYSPEQRRRHDVKPGITGWAQTHGRNAVEWDERFSLDCWYVDNWSNELDARILLATIRTVLAREGINHPGSHTMHEFMGAPTAGSNAPDGTG